MANEVDVTYYDPDSIDGCTIDDSWFYALNKIAPIFVDPAVIEIYRAALCWDSYVYSKVKVASPLKQDTELKRLIKGLISRNNGL